MEDEGDITKRKSRNISEKKRRDQFNNLVNELSLIVSANGRKLDKSSVLKSTISFLKNRNEITVRSRVHDIEEEWKPSFMSNDEFAHLILDALESFIMVFSATGVVKFVSEHVAALLGHLPADIMNKSIFDLAYDEDRPSLYNLLQNPGRSVDPMQPVVLKDNQIMFRCHIRRGPLDQRDESAYELVQFTGYFRSSADCFSSESTPDAPQNGGRLIFVCIGRLQLPLLIRDMSPLVSEHREFTSRHSLEWKYLFLDHRAPSIIGYMPFEVLGTSGYDYYHLDDLEKLATCHEALMQKGELTSCHYRFLTKGQQWIWLQTRFYITYHQWNSKPEFVVCTHRVVSYADVFVKCEEGDDEAPSTSFSHMDDAMTESGDMSEGDLSPTYVSESSDDFDRHRMSHTGSTHSMSTESGAGGSRAPSSSRPAGGSRAPSSSRTMKYTTSASSSSASVASQFDGVSWTRSARARYGSSESGSVPSMSTMPARRRQSPDPTRRPDPGELPHYLEIGQSSYAVPVPVVIAPAQVQLQDCMQKKHEELQQLIARQQEQLHRIAEQLVMARLGILPPAISYSDNAVLNGTAPQLVYELSAQHDGLVQPSSSLHPGLPISTPNTQQSLPPNAPVSPATPSQLSVVPRSIYGMLQLPTQQSSMQPGQILLQPTPGQILLQPMTGGIPTPGPSRVRPIDSDGQPAEDKSSPPTVAHYYF